MLFQIPPYKVDHTFAVSADRHWAHILIGYDVIRETQEGLGVRVGVVDTGIDVKHPAFRGRIVAQRDFTDRFNRNKVDDFDGHGTHVAGIIGASSVDGGRMSGVAPACDLVIARVFPTGSGATSKQVSDGIRFCVDEGCQVINLSLSAPTNNVLIQSACEYAETKGVFVVAAVGNSGHKVDVLFPAALPRVFGVGSCGALEEPSSFSCGGTEVDIVAPGERILSTWRNAGYASLDGTSMATPFVAGAAALLIEAMPEISPAQLREIFRATAKDVHKKGTDRRTGVGLLDVRKAILRVGNGFSAQLQDITEVDALKAFLEHGTAADLAKSGVFELSARVMPLTMELIEFILGRYGREDGTLKTPFVVRLSPLLKKVWAIVRIIVAIGREIKAHRG